LRRIRVLIAVMNLGGSYREKTLAFWILIHN
jgi:hypothetical protein